MLLLLLLFVHALVVYASSSSSRSSRSSGSDRFWPWHEKDEWITERAVGKSNEISHPYPAKTIK
jgi:hypothetical protein